MRRSECGRRIFVVSGWYLGGVWMADMRRCLRHLHTQRHLTHALGEITRSLSLGVPAFLLLRARWGQIVVIQQDPMGSAFEILVLVRAQAPEECAKTHGAERDRDRNEECYDVQERIPCSLSALSVTIKDEPAIATAAISGVTRPSAAIGTAMTL